MSFNFRKYLAFGLAVLALSSLVIDTADARGRTGGRRVYSGHGKGSHDVGGH